MKIRLRNEADRRVCKDIHLGYHWAEEKHQELGSLAAEQPCLAELDLQHIQ